MERTISLVFLLLVAVLRCHGQNAMNPGDHANRRAEWEKAFHRGYKAALDEHFNVNQKRYDIATLNQAARSRNPMLNGMGGDPYGMGSTVSSQQHLSFGRKKRFAQVGQESRRKRYLTNSVNFKHGYSAGYAAGREIVQKMLKEKNNPEKRFNIERLNQAARHRNVYLDNVGGDPYGGSSVVSSRQQVNWHHGKRSINSHDDSN